MTGPKVLIKNAAKPQARRMGSRPLEAPVRYSFFEPKNAIPTALTHSLSNLSGVALDEAFAEHVLVGSVLRTSMGFEIPATC